MRRDCISGSCSCSFDCSRNWIPTKQVILSLFFSKWSHHFLYMDWKWKISTSSVKCVTFLSRLSNIFYFLFWMWIWLWSKMCEAVFQILRFGKSLELIMASFQLLNELDEVFIDAFSVYILLLRCAIILTSSVPFWFEFVFSMQRYPRVFLSNSSSSAQLDLVAVKEVLNRLWLLNVFLILVVCIYICIYIKFLCLVW